MRRCYHVTLNDSNGIVMLTKGIEMDKLDPFLNNISFSAQSFFIGKLCELGYFDDERKTGHLHILRAGTLKITVGNETAKVLNEPCVLFFPRFCSHSLVPLDKTSGCELLCAYIDLGGRVNSPLSTALPDLMILPINEMKTLTPTFELLFSEAMGGALGRTSALDRLLEYLLIQMLRHLNDLGLLNRGIFAALVDERLANAVNAMHEHPSNYWTLDSLAGIAGMSRARFAVNFRETVGTTPLAYLTDWRISIAKNLLRMGRPLKTIASAVGYQSQSVLSRAFLQRVGHTPKDWLLIDVENK